MPHIVVERSKVFKLDVYIIYTYSQKESMLAKSK
jgi:hypothetical protein